jgi:hypothetical protein
MTALIYSVTSMRNAYNLSAPPMNVPLLIRSNVMFGGFLNQLGWFLLGLGLIGVWIFALNADLLSWYHFAVGTESASGQISHCDQTGFSVSNKIHSDSISAYHYSFKASGGKEYKGVSYCVSNGQFQTGAEVMVEYVKGNPDISRIKGMWRKPLHPGAALLTLIFPMFGVALIIGDLQGRIKAIRLLRYGWVGLGTLKSRVQTDAGIIQLTFEVTTNDKTKCETVVETYIPEFLEANSQKQILYDKAKPAYAVLLDSLQGRLRIDEQGRIRVRNYFTSLLVLIIPFVTIVGHGIYVYLRFISHG